jgi:hypothetical protein
MAAQPQYYIREGVRRAVAARDAGWTSLLAQVVVAGQADQVLRVQLNQLHSPKKLILRDSRYIRDTEYRTTVLKTEPPPIEVAPLGESGQSAAIPLAQVVLR